MRQIKLIEKRSDYRYRYLAEINYGSDYGAGQGLVRDISLGGVEISAERKIPVGTDVLVTIPLPKALRNVSLRGEVVRHTETGFALTLCRIANYDTNFDLNGVTLSRV
jgi:hypothetical protein